MKDLGVDVVISAPQKGWTGPCCAALVMMSERAVEKLQTTKETSFSMSLKRWSAIMDTYTAGGFGYHTTMPTDGLRDFHGKKKKGNDLSSYFMSERPHR
jgi:aspartate aminotransferase-like enzyme